MRKCLITYLVGVLLIPSIQADEGMWLVPLIKDLNMDRMQEMGLELDEFLEIGLNAMKEIADTIGL